MSDSPSTEATRGPAEPGPTAGLILAAGAATRMGRSKALLDWGGRTLLRHICEVALAAGLQRVFVVLGEESESVTRELEELEVEAIEHPGWRAGIGSSIAAGVRALQANPYRDPASGSRLEWEGVVVLLCDQPFVSPSLLRELIARAQGDDKAMAACHYGGSLGPPAYFSREIFPGLGGLVGDRGAKALLVEDPAAVARLEFPDGELDIDTPEDYRRALSELASRQR